MKKILNLLVIFGVIYLGSLIVPEYIMVDDWKSAAMASVLIFITQTVGSMIINFIAALLLIAILKCCFGSTVTVVTIIIVIIASICNAVISFGSILLIDMYLDSFTLSSKVVCIIVAALISMFTITESSSTLKNKKDN